MTTPHEHKPEWCPDDVWGRAVRACCLPNTLDSAEIRDIHETVARAIQSARVEGMQAALEELMREGLGDGEHGRIIRLAITNGQGE